ncbi:MAG: hypothetical protein JRF15_10865 [Deltaproteobacteria bacterium]|jgi:hypothetical protein|nr:hypothetical protein [Deltaproteobacteria bacterium]
MSDQKFHSSCERNLQLVAVLATLALFGCAAAPGNGTIQFSATDSIEATGRDVTVSVDASGLSGDRREAFLQQAGSRKIANKVLQKLWSGGGKNQLPDAVNIRVTQFRLRSGSTGFWLGAMAGADQIAVTVEVVNEGGATRSFATDTSTAIAGIIRPGAVERFDRMVNTLAERIAAGI